MKVQVQRCPTAQHTPMPAVWVLVVSSKHSSRWRGGRRRGPTWLLAAAAPMQAAHLGRGQEAGAGVDGALGVVELEVGGLQVGRRQVGKQCHDGGRGWKECAQGGLLATTFHQGRQAGPASLSCVYTSLSCAGTPLTLWVRARLALKKDSMVPMSSQ